MKEESNLLRVVSHGKTVLRITADKKVIPGEGLTLEESMQHFADHLAASRERLDTSLVVPPCATRGEEPNAL